MPNPRREHDNQAAEEASAMGERATGAAKEGWGKLTGDEDVRREGRFEKEQGRARQEANEVFDRDVPERADRRWVTGTFRDRESAERAYTSLTGRGYTKDDVNLLMSDETRRKYFTDDPKAGLGSKAMEGAGAGGAIGGTVGAILAALVAVGTSVAIPGLGLVIAGPLAAALAGAGAGGLTGGIIGALVGAGIPEDRAKLYDRDIRSGGIVMGVNPRTDEDARHFESEWRNYKGENVHYR